MYYILHIIIIFIVDEDQPLIDFPSPVNPNEPVELTFTMKFGSYDYDDLDEDIQPQLSCYLDGVFLEPTEENRPTSGIEPGSNWYTFDNVSPNTAMSHINCSNMFDNLDVDITVSYIKRSLYISIHVSDTNRIDDMIISSQ